jgi:uncharacterized protein (DUF983 family)
MSTTPPEQPSSSQRSSGSNVSFNVPATMPIPGNAELVVYILAAIIVAIIALASDGVNPPEWVEWFKWVTAAYLISRGIAKASRVLER